MVGKEQVVSGPFAGLVEQEHSMPLGSTTFSPSLKIWPDSVMQFGPVEHRGGDDNNNNSYIALYPVKSHKLEVIMTTTTTPHQKRQMM